MACGTEFKLNTPTLIGLVKHGEEMEGYNRFGGEKTTDIRLEIFAFGPVSRLIFFAIYSVLSLLPLRI